MAVRIGIDVGGTFTDAVAIDNDTYELIGSVKTPTTHTAPEGVAAGIVQVLHKVMEQCHIAPEDVVFIAHGTTQATNALLEGDVAQVGVITLGKGLQGAKSKGDTTIGNIELAEGKYLVSKNAYVDTGNLDQLDETIRQAIRSLKEEGCTSFVAAEAFSVDDPGGGDLRRRERAGYSHQRYLQAVRLKNPHQNCCGQCQHHAQDAGGSYDDGSEHQGGRY